MQQAARPADLQLRKELRALAPDLLGDIDVEDSGALQLIDKALAAVDKKGSTAADRMLPLTLLQDLLDYTPLQKCPAVVAYMERSDVKIKKCLDSMPPKLAILALCKKLTGRLCMTMDTLFYGRVMLLLTRFFDMYERSGLNLQGEVSQMDTTIDPEQEEEEPPVPSPTAAPGLEGTDPVKYDFYKRFWGFQTYFSHPNSLPDALDKFSEELQEILKEFDSNLRLDSAEASSWGLYNVSSLSSAGAVEGVKAEDMVLSLPKYLTSRRLMSLQLRDSTFRRYVLVQVLVLLHSVKNYRQGKEAQLSAAQATKLDTIHNQVVNCLRKIPPNGETFVKCVLQALRKETVWIQWKLDKCPQAKGGKGAEGASALLEQHAAGKTKEVEKKRHRMGNAALSQLADDHDVPPEQLCHLAKKGMSPEAFLQEFKAQMDPDSGVEKQYYLSKNRLYVWRALRIVARTSLMVFCKSLGSTVAEKSTSEMYEKLVRDLDEQALKDEQAAKEEQAALEKEAAPAEAPKDAAAVGPPDGAPAPEGGEEGAAPLGPATVAPPPSEEPPAKKPKTQ